MKKVFVCLFVLILPLSLTACKDTNENLVKNNLSEVTYDYFLGEEETFSVSLSVGKREEPYMLDGISQKKTEFSLIVFKDKTNVLYKNYLDAKLTINGEEKQIALQYNPLNNCYMFDLGYKVSGKLNFEFGEQKIELKKANFNIDSQKALKLACQAFEDNINQYKSSGKLFAECYLKVMGEADGGLFWCFTIIGQNSRCFNLILSTADGKIVASD